jgi:hypothetical protein
VRHSMLQARAEVRIAESQPMLRRRRQRLRHSGQGLGVVLQARDDVLLQRHDGELLRGRSDVRQRRVPVPKMPGRTQAVWQHLLQSNRRVRRRNLLPKTQNGL